MNFETQQLICLWCLGLFFFTLGALTDLVIIVDSDLPHWYLVFSGFVTACGIYLIACAIVDTYKLIKKSFVVRR